MGVNLSQESFFVSGCISGDRKCLANILENFFKCIEHLLQSFKIQIWSSTCLIHVYSEMRRRVCCIKTAHKSSAVHLNVWRQWSIHVDLRSLSFSLYIYRRTLLPPNSLNRGCFDARILHADCPIYRTSAMLKYNFPRFWEWKLEALFKTDRNKYMWRKTRVTSTPLQLQRFRARINGAAT